MKKLSKFTLGSLMAVSFSLGASAQVHNEVQKALDWTLPVLECKKPVLRREGIVSYDDGGATQHDIDSYTLNRHERKLQRWDSCVAKYKEGLRNDFENLKNCAQYGLTQAQANIVLGNMALIQSSLISPDGNPERSSKPN